MVEEAVILAGGMGKRLRPLTNDKPKPMIEINGKPMIDIHFSWLKKHGIKKIIVACGYKWEKIKEHYGNDLVYSVEKEPLGTGGALKKALEHVDNDAFLVVNCDDINDVDIDQLRSMGPNTVCVSNFNCRFGLVDIDEQGNILGFKQKPRLPYWANMGVYLLNKELPYPDKGSLEEDVFPQVKLKAYKHKGMWVTINTKKDLEEAEKVLQ